MVVALVIESVDQPTLAYRHNGVSAHSDLRGNR